MDAGEAATRLASEGAHPDAVSYTHLCTRLTGRKAMLVSPALNTGLTFAVDAPDRVGRDRIAAATAAAAPYPLPCMSFSCSSSRAT